MDQSFPQSDVIAAIKARLKLAFGARNLSNTDAKYIGEQAGVKINQLVNDSFSELFSVDSFSEVDIVIPFASGIYQSGTATVFAGNNTILLGEAFPNTNYTIQLSIFDVDGGAIAFNKPTNLTVNSFDVYVTADGTLTYIVIRNT